MITGHFALNGNMRLFILLFSILWAGISVPYVLHAQTDTSRSIVLKEIQINEILKRKTHLSPTSVQVLSGAELKRLNTLSVADAVRYFSGVQLKDYGGIGGLKTINVRSMGSNHTAVFYDGVQLGNAQNGQIDLGKYALTNVDEISLYSGQRGELLQPAKAFASASSLFIKTKAPVFNQSRQTLDASLKTGSFGLVNPALLYAYQIRQNLAISLNLEFLNANGKYKFRRTNGTYDTTVVRSNADILAYRIETGLYGKTADSSKWDLKFYKYQSERGVPGAIVSNKYDFNQRQWDDNTFLQASYQNNPAKRYNILIHAKYANDYMRYTDPTMISDEGILNNIYKQQEWYLSAANVYHLSNSLDFSLSGDFSRQTLNANLKYFAYPTRNTLLVVAAGKYHIKRLELQANILATRISEAVKMYNSAGGRTEYTPTAMFSLQPFQTPNIRIKGFYKSIFRMPTFNDLYYTFIGNTNLRPEFTKQYDLGINYQMSRAQKYLKLFSVQTDVYYNQVRDKIVAIPTLNLFRWTMVNLDAVSIKGLEINIKSLYKFGNVEWNSNASYTYEKALDVTKTGFTYKNQIPYIPLHSGSFTSGLAYKNYGANYSFIYTGARYSQKANIPVNYVEPYYTHDLAVYRLFGNHHQYKINAEVNNLLNQDYDVVLNFPMPGRNLRFTLSIKI